MDMYFLYPLSHFFPSVHVVDGGGEDPNVSREKTSELSLSLCSSQDPTFTLVFARGVKKFNQKKNELSVIWVCVCVALEGIVLLVVETGVEW